MGWDLDNSEDDDGQTDQQAYYAHLVFLRRCGKHDTAAKLSAGGPPPITADGARGWLRWGEHHSPTAQELAQLLRRLHTEELITAHTWPPNDPKTVKTLSALVSGHDTRERARRMGRSS
ncbi:hypothetical protein [Nocardia xishanensis]